MALSFSAFAQDTPTAATESTEAQLAALRETVEKQNQRIEALTREVIRLSRIIEGGSASGPSVQTGPVSSASPSRSSATPPKAAPVQPSGPTHTVSKGETLTIIAKSYNTSVEELVKLNNIKDERLLQIGQVLILPESATSEATPES